MRQGVVGLIFVLCALIYPLLPANLSLQALFLVVTLAVQGLLARAAKPIRALLLVDILVLFGIQALWIASPSGIPLPYNALAWLGHTAIVLILGWAAGRWLRPAVYWGLIGFSVIGLLAALLLLPPHFSLLALLLAAWICGVLPLVGAALLFRNAQMPALSSALLLIPVAAGCFISLRSVHAFPNFSATDEAIITSYVDTFTRSGRVEASIVPDAPAPLMGSLYIRAASLWTDLFPRDPYALRTLSMLGGIVLLGVVFMVGRALDSPLTGGITAALLATNLLWNAAAHVGRQEIWLAVFVWAALWLSLAARRRQSWLLALLAGVTIALSADVHPLGAYACVALGAWWLVRMNDRRLLSVFLVGGLLGAAYFVCAHVLPDPARFLASIRAEAVANGAEGWMPLAAMFARHLNYLKSNPFELLMLLACAVIAMSQRRAQRLGVFLGVLPLLYALTVADPNPYYPIVWMTGIVLLAAVGVRHIPPHWHMSLLLAFAGTFVLNAAMIERHVQADWNDRALDALEQVAARVPQSQPGTGETFLYLGLHDPDFIGFTFVNFRAAETNVPKWAVIEALHPGWIVTMSDESAFTPEFDVLSVDLPHMRLEIPNAALEQAYRLLDTVVTSVGSFEIWQRS